MWNFTTSPPPIQLQVSSPVQYLSVLLSQEIYYKTAGTKFGDNICPVNLCNTFPIYAKGGAAFFFVQHMVMLCVKWKTSIFENER